MRQTEMASFKCFLQNPFDDFDMYQEMFEDDTEEFYGTPPIMPSEDIWKKFELPTPPRSPRRDDGFLDLEDTIPFDIGVREPLSTKILTFPETPPSPNLQSKLIQDCMWSGGLPGLSDQMGDKPKTKGSVAGVGSTGSNFDMHSTDCVDPAAVFPYPISSVAETRLHSLGTETPSDSEEEIDVVTVEKQKRVTTVTVRRRQVPAVVIKTEPVDPSETIPVQKVSRFQSNSRVDTPTDVHNYSLSHSQSYKRLRSLPNSSRDSSTPTKRLKREISMPELKRAVQKLKSSSSSSCSSRNSSDSEEGGEGGKRTQHNVLERKRRDDLKSSFFKLRDSVPELNKQERAPKVMILRRAADFIKKLTEDNYRLMAEHELYTDKHNQLKRTLGKLMK